MVSGDDGVFQDLAGHLSWQRTAVREVSDTAASHETSLIGEHFSDHQLVCRPVVCVCVCVCVCVSVCVCMCVHVCVHVCVR